MRWLIVFIGSYLFAWQLIGGFDGNISALKPYVAWKYDNGWYGYSDDSEIKEKIVLKYPYFEWVRENKGVWVKDEVNFIPKRALFFKLNRGWNLIGGVSTFEIDKLGYAWIYEKGWKTTKDLGYPKIEIVNASNGIWVYSESDKNVSFNYTKFMPYYPVGSGDFDIGDEFIYSFIISNGSCDARWDWDIDSKLDSYKLKGGAISFGGAGAENKNLAYVCTEDELFNEYQKIISLYGMYWLDFDIEGGMLSESEANLKRFRVLKRLKEKYPNLIISLTLPVMPYGFEDDVKDLIALAKEVGLDIDIYNLMLMDFGEEYVANSESEVKMYEYSVSAIESVNNYLKTILNAPLLDNNYYYKIGATAMIGVNDIENEIFFKNDFALLRDYVLKKGLRVLSYWGIHRDEGFEYYDIGDIVTLNTISYLNKEDDFYWQLQGDIKINDAKIYDIDLFDNSKEFIKKLKDMGKIVICYVNAGAWEEWREDAALFSENVIGNSLDGWEGERWLDIRSNEVREIIKKRFDLALEKGCDGIEPDNIDGFLNNTGFDLTYDDQLEYNKFLAIEAKKRGLLIAQKNDFTQTKELVNYFDFLISEEAIEQNLTDYFLPYIIQKKPIFDIEYNENYFKCSDKFKVYLMNLELDGEIYKSCK